MRAWKGLFSRGIVESPIAFDPGNAGIRSPEVTETVLSEVADRELFP